MRALLLLGFVLVVYGNFTNPIFKSQDPWITKVDGVYYYTQSGCGSSDICVKISKTLTGLSSAKWTDLWKAPSGAPNSHDVWAPEMHYILGKWYIYYAADDGDNNNHRLFVLESDKPTGPFKEGKTSLPHGQLDESTGHWAIDPDVFYAADGHLYITWSCTNYADSTFPQRICLARMSDPLTMGPTSFLSTPTAYWETRGEPIQEGPVGYTYANHTYITYSGSASWISNDYSVGLLSLTPDTDALTPENWVKSGPILDHHSLVYGPGSVVFTPSVDDSEYWVLYHAIDSDDCKPNAYACRNIRMQKMYFDPIGYPVLGYPVNPGVELESPAGEDGSHSGTIQIADFGDAWGDAAEGDHAHGLVAGNWSYSDRYDATSGLGGAWDQIFSPWNPNPDNFTAHVEVKHEQTGKTIPYPKYGFYCAYDDDKNHAELFLDVNYKVLASHAVVNGVDQGWKNADLPSDFDPSKWHSLDCTKSGTLFTFSLDKGAVKDSRHFDLVNGQTGLAVVDTMASYRNLQLYPVCC